MILSLVVSVCAITAIFLIFHRTFERQRWQTLIKRWLLVHVIQSQATRSSFEKYLAYRDHPSLQNKTFPCFLSLTTTPTRLKELPKILKVFEGLTLGIHINLPSQFRNDPANGYAFEDIQELAKVQGVSIFQGGHDTGPNMKILPTFQRFVADETVTKEKIKQIITLDDDHFQDPRMLVFQDSLFSDWVGLGTGMKMHQASLPVAFGVSSLAFHASIITKDLVQKIQTQSSLQGCHFHDDMCIAHAIQDLGIPIQTVKVNRTPTHNSFSQEALWFVDPAKDVHCWNSIQKYKKTVI